MTTYHQLTQEERYVIAAFRARGISPAEISRDLGRDRSTIGREIRRNATTHDGMYRAQKAQSYTTARRRRSRRGSQFSAEQMDRVSELLRKYWSPEQISGYLQWAGEFTISHETIYRYIRLDKRQGGDLWKSTRIMSKVRRKRYRSQDSRGVLPGKRHISERPPEVLARQHLGHWEGDTVMGSDMRHCLLTLVEIKSGFTIIEKLSARTKDEVTRAASEVLRMHAPMFKTITLDNGTEFHDYKKLEERFPVKIFFATPYHAWERGCNENLNGLIRQYLPKKTCMKAVTQRQCEAIAYSLNTRPRKRHGFRTPIDVAFSRYPNVALAR